MLTKDSKKLKLEARQKVQEAQTNWQRTQVKLQRARDAATIAADTGRDVTTLEAQIGRPLHGREIRKRLTRLNSMLRFEVSNADPEVTGIYIGSSFICGMQSNETPEFSIRHAPSGFVMRGETRGWRTVLVRLIHIGLIGKIEAENAFQINFSSTESANWQKMVN